jgi:hypothetical protein
VQSALKAGLVYFAIVFCAGFLFGTVRVLALAPRVGEALAVAIELPLMLAVSWLVCRRLIARLGVPAGLTPRLTMGGFAFGLLMVAEIGVSVLALGRTLSEHIEAYQTTPALMGLLGQIAFALFPVWVRNA